MIAIREKEIGYRNHTGTDTKNPPKIQATMDVSRFIFDKEYFPIKLVNAHKNEAAIAK